jgi:hypothetical protein
MAISTRWNRCSSGSPQYTAPAVLRAARRPDRLLGLVKQYLGFTQPRWKHAAHLWDGNVGLNGNHPQFVRELLLAFFPECRLQKL